jgi:putative membrane protein
MKPASLLLCGAAALVAGWSIAAATRAGMTGHMAAHMAAVAIAAPLIARAIAGARFDPAVRWPRIVAPLPMSVVELLVVWGWHLPAARAFAAESAAGLMLEQAMFFAAGLLLWSACLGAADDVGSSARRAQGVIALLLTTMHMTLLGTLIALAPRTLYGTAGCSLFGLTLPPLEDQQIGGVIMLLVGAGSYLAGGLVLLFHVLRSGERRAALP